ncbi:MAG TPA: potassium transporter Kup [Gemmatimonadales bacterium]|nr:potassium transporter Kup [Gemmatimonadales bacterium]
MSIAALGVVFGDIGTSPLYALREGFYGAHAVAPTPENVLGVLSLIFWALVLVISVKYLVFILRADNRGEGGILALMALLLPRRRATGPRLRAVVALGLFGAALLYGDGMITPAISVLSAIEGLKVATPLFEPYVIPITAAILVGLFAFQARGTAGVGAVFGPITLLWFVVIAILGITGLMRSPGVLAALDPLHAVDFFARNGWHGFLVLGAVVLVVTGGEALYADMGHFGRMPIRRTWFTVVLPALLLNYFGQGALVLSDPETAHNPFYRLAPGWALYPLVALATAATVIASQAVISGAFSLTRQAIQLGYSPRLVIEHTSSEEIGQIYVPLVNWGLMVATIWLVVTFRSSSNLAAAYGVAVTGTMAITTVLFYLVARKRWNWGLERILPLAAFFLAIDLAFLGATLVKIAQGGWFPLAVAAGVYVLMTTWKRGREILAERLRAASPPLDRVLADVRAGNAVRVPGTAVFLTGSPHATPLALVQNLKHNKVVHEQVVLLTIVTEEIPHVAAEERLEVESLGLGFYRLTGWYGFMEDPNIPRLLERARAYGLVCDPDETTYFLGRETLLATERPGMAIWREKLFAFLSRNQQRAAAFFHIPPDRAIEVGALIEM